MHDAEYYILEAQNGERWSAEDKVLGSKLAELREKHGRPPNIIHIMWDDTAFGDVGIPAIQQIRGLRTPNLNAMARQGILFTRMYTEVGCTPSRAACITGRYAVRSGMYNIGMLRESHGMREARKSRLPKCFPRRAMRPPSTANGILVTSKRVIPTSKVSTRRSLRATTRFCRLIPEDRGRGQRVDRAV